jgi:hypothetical protein
LEERLNGIEEVVSSNLIGSTISNQALTEKDALNRPLAAALQQATKKAV